MYLDEIVAHHRDVARKDTRDVAQLVAQARKLPEARGFARVIRETSRQHLAVIAEIKRRSPSKGALNLTLDSQTVARSYEVNGASCISVLTDEKFFGGSYNDLTDARKVTTAPIIRKDFTVSFQDICDTRLMSADCVLLIAAALSAKELVEFYEFALGIGLDALVEVHDEHELDLAVGLGATLIGVNQRDLTTFEVDRGRASRLASRIPAGVVKVAESGVRTGDDARALRDAGYDAVLVGESLITSADVAASLQALLVR